MFLQIITEHQGHLLIRVAIVVVILVGFLLLFGYFNKKILKKKPEDSQNLNIEVSGKRKNKKRWRKSNRGK